MDTPYQWTKQVASHWGGTRNATIVHWPEGIRAKGEIRSQFSHVIDVAPTVLEAAGIPAPTMVNSIQQAPLEGSSMLYAFDDAGAAERHVTQYFEMFCNRGIYHKGWTAVTRHGVPWVGAYDRSFDEDVWELYDTNTDWTQSKDVAKQYPEKLAEMKRMFLIEAVKYNVLPLDDRSFERFNADIAGRPQLIKGKTQMLFGGMHRLQEGSILQTHNKSYSLTAEIEVPESGANGVIVALGAGIGGWSLYAKDGKLKHCYNFFGIKHFFAEGQQEIPAGKHQVRMEFAYDGGGLAKGGTVSLYVDGNKDGEGRVDITVPMLFGTDTCDVGSDGGSPVSPDYGAKDNKFNGTVNWVQIDIDEESEDLDHLITPEERYKVAMARQ
jgi:arylsulfatase